VETSVPSPEVLRALAPCPNCGVRAPVHRERLTKDGGLLGCLACEHPELFTRKSMPPALGILVVVVAAVLAPFTMYLSLVVAAVIDLVLFGIVPDVVTCYVCGAEHRGFQREPRHPRFDREIAERLRFGARAVMGRPMREGGTANAPDPEH
jgi:hypothetical protein